MSETHRFPESGENVIKTERRPFVEAADIAA